MNYIFWIILLNKRTWWQGLLLFWSSCCSLPPRKTSCRKTAWQGARGQENQAISRVGDEDQSVLYKVLAKLSLSSSKKRKLQKDSSSREPEGKTTNHQAMNIKTRSSSTKAAAVQNNCCPTATIVWSVLVCYKALQGTTRCYKVLQGTCQVIPLHLQETQVAKRHLQLQPDDKTTTTSPIRCRYNYFLICLSVQQCAATCFSTSKKHKLQKHIWRQDYCWPNQVTWSKQHQENNQTNQPVTIQGTLWYSQIIESSF